MSDNWRGMNHVNVMFEVKVGYKPQGTIIGWVVY